MEDRNQTEETYVITNKGKWCFKAFLEGAANKFPFQDLDLDRLTAIYDSVTQFNWENSLKNQL